jgi:hypothetical protein
MDLVEFELSQGPQCLDNRVGDASPESRRQVDLYSVRCSSFSSFSTRIPRRL